jgi:hypothetical protein
MIALAPYPNGVQMDAWWSPPGGADPLHLAQPSVIRQCDEVVGHYNNVSDWCKGNLIGPYELDEKTDILFDGVRIRIGRESDMAYFQLRWG